MHRDIEPSDIRVGRHGQVKLPDGGIARAGGVSREAHTDSRSMLGSYLYMAPERFLDPANNAPQSDVFSLGCVLFEGNVGQRLFGELTLNERYALVLDGSK